MNPLQSETRNSAGPLAALAHEKVIAALKGYGNVVGVKHALALRQLMDGLTKQGLGIERGRFAYGLPPGTGKTQGVIAWIAAAWELRLGLSVAVSAAQIEALCDLKRHLVCAGVPISQIGLRHSYGAQASEPDTGDDDRPIMLVSHSRIRGGRNAILFSHRLGKPRDLLIWDETLMTTNAESLSWWDVKPAVDRVRSDLQAGRHAALLEALGKTVEVLGSELASQELGGPSSPLMVSFSDLDAAQKQAETLGQRGGLMRSAAVKTVRTLLKMVQLPVAIARTGTGASGDGVIRYTVAVDPGLTNIAVLDASHPIRILARNGGVADRTTAEMRRCKSYENVSICEVPMAAGKTSLSSEASLSGVANRVAEVLREADASEHVLLVTFKGTDDRLPSRLMARLANHDGIDTAKTIDGRPRIETLTWGRETSLNTLKHCKHVILVGVLRRSLLDLAANAAAVANDLSYRPALESLRELETSEMAHCVFQAMNRGSCRVMTEPGKADPMKVTIIGNVSGVQETLRDVLPGVQWVRQDPDRHPRAGSQTAEAAYAVEAILRSIPQEQPTLPICKLKAAVDSPLGRDCWREALTHGLLLARLPLRGGPVRWEKAGQVLRRAA